VCRQILAEMRAAPSEVDVNPGWRLAIAHSSGPGLDWPAVMRQAQAWELVLPLQKVLPEFARDYGLAELELVLAPLAALRPNRAEKAAFDRLASGSRTSGWGRRLAFAAANLFPSRAYMRRRYGIANSVWTPSYYPYRWFLGARSALWKVK
jgi:hypothetical protein